MTISGVLGVMGGSFLVVGLVDFARAKPRKAIKEITFGALLLSGASYFAQSPELPSAGCRNVYKECRQALINSDLGINVDRDVKCIESVAAGSHCQVLLTDTGYSKWEARGGAPVKVLPIEATRIPFIDKAIHFITLHFSRYSSRISR
jgi:hypothetical protein